MQQLIIDKSRKGRYGMNHIKFIAVGTVSAFTTLGVMIGGNFIDNSQALLPVFYGSISLMAVSVLGMVINQGLHDHTSIDETRTITQRVVDSIKNKYEEIKPSKKLKI